MREDCDSKLIAPVKVLGQFGADCISGFTK